MGKFVDGPRRRRRHLSNDAAVNISATLPGTAGASAGAFWWPRSGFFRDNRNIAARKVNKRLWIKDGVDKLHGMIYGLSK